MGEHIFPKVFPYFFPLAVFTVRIIWYIRYILKTDLNLMIPDVVVWQLMDRVKQIRIPHPRRKPNASGDTKLYSCGIRTHLNATVQWTVARCGLDRSDTIMCSNPSSVPAAVHLREIGTFIPAGFDPFVLYRIPKDLPSLQTGD